MPTFAELIGTPTSKNKIKKALEKASVDLAKDKEKYFDHLAMHKAAQVSNKETVRK